MGCGCRRAVDGELYRRPSPSEGTTRRVRRILVRRGDSLNLHHRQSSFREGVYFITSRSVKMGTLLLTKTPVDLHRPLTARGNVDLWSARPPKHTLWGLFQTPNPKTRKFLLFIFCSQAHKLSLLLCTAPPRQLPNATPHRPPPHPESESYRVQYPSVLPGLHTRVKHTVPPPRRITASLSRTDSPRVCLKGPADRPP